MEKNQTRSKPKPQVLLAQNQEEESSPRAETFVQQDAAKGFIKTEDPNCYINCSSAPIDEYSPTSLQANDFGAIRVQRL